MLTISGVVLGTKTVNKTRKPDNSQYQVHYVGIQSEKANGYQGEMVTTDVMITRDQFGSGVAAKYENLRGQVVSAEVFVQAWQNGKGVQYILAGDGVPMPAKKVA